MKVIKTRKFGNRLILELDTELPDNFRNNSNLLIDGNIYFNAIIPMFSATTSRKDVSVKFEKEVDLLNKEVSII
ncbi:MULTISPECIES: hypothetical protein [unclassified Gemella]|uniref:hypothetical protein n=1 Tax=unclassified Gemella TaxID=2624949 RepID=UPI001C059C03|nr:MULTISPECIES: hypothetical protein [unclassified Gemella]MBU0279343.1 hypothetical protein [Gemella sp. zg-1178]QWQ39296.1 hypothetical protein KMP11_02935 [Gemella sp. zg-570]